LVLGRDLVMVPKLIHPLPPDTPRTPDSSSGLEDDGGGGGGGNHSNASGDSSGGHHVHANDTWMQVAGRVCGGRQLLVRTGMSSSFSVAHAIPARQRLCLQLTHDALPPWVPARICCPRSPSTRSGPRRRPAAVLTFQAPPSSTSRRFPIGSILPLSWPASHACSRFCWAGKQPGRTALLS
jgi:hypothetical protein